MISHPCWLQSGRILWWMKVEVSPYDKRIIRTLFFPVGRIICEENKQSTNNVNSSQRVKPALEVASGNNNYPGHTRDFKGRDIDPPSITGFKQVSSCSITLFWTAMV